LSNKYSKVINIGNATLYLANSYDLVLDLKADAMITDPPYEFETSGGGMFRAKRTNMDEIESAGISKGFNLSILKAFGVKSVITFCHNDQLKNILNMLDKNYERQCIMMWIKSNPMPVANRHYQPDSEFYVHAWNSDSHPLGDLVFKKRNWQGKGGKDTTILHPTVKQLALMEKIMMNINGEVIIDPFMGSGTTGIAALNKGKSFIGIEKDEDYFNLAVKRISNNQSQSSSL
jgi:DNA modification methylase